MPRYARIEKDDDNNDVVANVEVWDSKPADGGGVRYRTMAWVRDNNVPRKARPAPSPKKVAERKVHAFIAQRNKDDALAAGAITQAQKDLLSN